ncbi:MAG TPA: DUF4349 domain-containing protein [Planctomycetaceae bacterium]|nr:DUF4349 domain-containing protein [Planctomycetaceae bacterium]HIQ23329.1 DUF4349 domain-containing protein [Planctomycetota bacterium]
MRCFPLLLLLVSGCGTAELGEDLSSPAEEAAPDHVLERRGEGESQTPVPATEAIRRKIIYTATVDMVVEEFSGIPEQVEKLTRQYGGYVARSEQSGAPGSPRRGHWTLRVPVDRFASFLGELLRLGEVRRVTRDSRDVTEEYYDVEARLRNKRREEERLLKLLADATGKLDEVLRVEKELTRVRGEIERVEGRLRVLDDLTAMSTIELHVDEIKDYVPESQVSYATRLRRAFRSSVSALVKTGANLLLFLVILAPWLAVSAVGLAIVIPVVHLFRRGKGGS